VGFFIIRIVWVLHKSAFPLLCSLHPFGTGFVKLVTSYDRAAAHFSPSREENLRHLPPAADGIGTRFFLKKQKQTKGKKNRTG
jgi:hypothetical protein